GSQGGEDSGGPPNPTLEESGDKCSNRSSVLSDMLQQLPRRVSRAAAAAAAAATAATAAHDRHDNNDDKLLRVAYLFSPGTAGSSGLLASLGEWRFDVLQYGGDSSNPLCELGFILLSPFCFDTPGDQTLIRFLKTIDKYYLPVPYHNALHGLMVAQKIYALLNFFSLIRSRQPRDIALILVAGKQNK
ncbi:3',5'-cyclic nucleotide phosphodiesterase, putative, partial [Eimeria tenella]